MDLRLFAADALIPIELGRLTPRTRFWKREPALEFELGCLPLQDDLSASQFAGPTLHGQLEMYGGAGLAANAGGVRCANVGTVQIKGVGRTCLAGAGTDKWHRHGAMSLQDSIKEAIFSELFHAASPAGAVRALGVYDLGVRFATEIGEDKRPGSAPRALFVREQSVRVAHFMRASFMDVGADLAAQDLRRMRAGVPRLMDHFAIPGEKVDFEQAVSSLMRLYGRLMEQIAVLRTKRLVHGSLIPSNFCIDGRLLDFTTSTAVSTLQPVMVSYGGVSSQQQHLQVLESLPDLLFYVSKFDGRCAVARSRWSAALDRMGDALCAVHHEHLMRQHLHLYGFTGAEIDALSDASRTALLTALLRAIGRGRVEGHMYFGGDEHPMLGQTGRDDVFAVIAHALASAHDLTLPMSEGYRPDPQAFGPLLLEEMTAAFRGALRELGEAGQPALQWLRGRGRLIRALLRNADLSGLYRRRIDGDINDLCEGGGNFAVFIDETLHRWRHVFYTPDSGEVGLQGWLTANAVWLAPDGTLTCEGRPLSPADLGVLPAAPGIAARHAWLLAAMRANGEWLASGLQ